MNKSIPFYSSRIICSQRRDVSHLGEITNLTLNEIFEPAYGGAILGNVPAFGVQLEIVEVVDRIVGMGYQATSLQIRPTILLRSIASQVNSGDVTPLLPLGVPSGAVEFVLHRARLSHRSPKLARVGTVVIA